MPKRSTKASTSQADSVICAGCQRRFIGGTFASRILRWKQHADEDGCGVEPQP